jgi:hypothetical protein
MWTQRPHEYAIWLQPVYETPYGPKGCYQIATTLAPLRQLILALEPNLTMDDTGLELAARPRLSDAGPDSLR